MVSRATERASRVWPGRSPSESMPHTKKAVVTEFRKAEILRAAGRVFAEQGFDRATIAGIAEAAGIAKGTVYLYFPSKQHVYSAVLSRAAADLAHCARTAMAGDASLSGQVRAFVGGTLRYFEENRDVLRLCRFEAGRALGRLDAAAPEPGDPLREPLMVLESMLQHAMRRGAIRKGRARAAAVAVLDIVRGVASRRLIKGSRKPLEKDVAFAFDLIWKGIGQR